MLSSVRLPHLLAAILALGSAARATAQVSSSAGGLSASLTEGVITVSSDSVDRLRLAQLEGRAPLQGLMLRSTSTLMNPRNMAARARRFTIVTPALTFVNNGSLPFGQNDGALWAGVGTNVRALAGFTATVGPVRLIVIPEFVHSANKDLSIDPYDFAFGPQLFLRRARNHFSSPWNQFPYSIDMPPRFGDSAFSKTYLGQSSLTFTAGPVEAGAATENEWWGPALRNPIMMSDNAAGFPHAFIRTSRPLSTMFGTIEARWIVGALHESKWFTRFTDADNIRSLSAAALAWKRSPESGLTLGITRSVFSATTGSGDVAGHFLDVLKKTGHPDALPVNDSSLTPGKDQLISLFARWALPVYGLESYVEWGRADLPVSLRDFIEQPDNSRGYTAGVQWVRPIGSDSHFRIQGELTNVEQSTTYQFRPVGSFYTSRAAIQGYTNEGQVLGAGIGPGSSGQWIASDYFKGSWQFGVTAGRTRFNNDPYWLLNFALVPFAFNCGNDVTTYPGVRAGYSNARFRVRADYTAASRYNTFFQNRNSCQPGGDGSDRTNKNFSLTLTTFGW